MTITEFRKIVKEAKANFIVKRWAIVNLEIFDEYLRLKKENKNETKD